MKLAIHTGAPLFATVQHVGGPIVEPETLERFRRLQDAVFARNYFTNNGPLARRLEEEVAARHNVRHAVVVANGTLAQLLVVKAMGLEKGEAIVSGNTFIATAHACAWEGMKIRFADIEPETLAIDPDDVERKITSETRAIVPTHIFGVFADMKKLRDIAKRRNVMLLADAAHCFDCERDGTKAGGFDVPEWLSFHATKFFSTFEGGAVVTNDDALAGEIRALRAFGHDGPVRNGMVGLNAKLSEIHAAMGLASLPALEERKRALFAVRQTYVNALAGIPGVRVYPVGADGENNCRYFAFSLGDEYGVPREALVDVLRRENVLLQLYFAPGCQRHEYYRSLDPDMANSLPATDAALERIVCLPTSFCGVDPIEAAKSIAGVVESVHSQSGRVLEWRRASR
jgi:Predicted pyridoxal phosphate-dependent enzyme apparently involved in regulation of cell wall biogenesis